jgi:hypothetical protein
MLKLASRILAVLAAAPAAALAQPPAPGCGPHKDFLVRSDPTLAPIRPTECASVTQTPPEFTWPPQSGRNTYQVILTLPDGRVESRSSERNWLLWDQTLPPGNYSWKVKVSGANKDESEARRFTIAPGALAFVVPSGGAMVKRARETPRPRTWASDATDPIATFKSSRAKGFAALLGEVDGVIDRPVQEEPRAGSNNSNYEDTVAEQKRTLASALAWVGTKNPKYGADGARRLVAQARWSTSGPIAYAGNDMASRTVAWTLALGYDWMNDYLSDSQKALIRAAIKARTQPMLDDLLERRLILSYPYDSHGNETLTITAAIGALMAGDIPEADQWVKEALPAAVVWTSPWGWQDGGFGNGTAQGFWDTGTNLPAWNIFRNAAGVDLAKKEWVRNHARFFAYFVPPGAPAGNFGDGQEMNVPELWSRVSKALAQFAPTPLGRWYAKQHDKEDPTRLEVLLAPNVDLGPAPFPADTPNAAYFPSIGWVAMHSSLADPNRTSIYFKASPYGSYNHSHGDQLSFTVNHRGRRLAIASGYYDDYGSKHWGNWYKQTRATNAITVDGAQGQGFNDKKYSGEITRFESTAAYDYAVGRAEQAYDGRLTRAQRSIVYLHPNTVVVYDNFASATPRTWEWNLHAVDKLTEAAPKRIQVRNGPAQMCVELVSAPDVAFTQTDQYSTPPSGKWQKEWHGTFATTAKSPAAEFVAVMRLGAGCTAKAAMAGITHEGAAVRVDVDGKAVTFAADAVSVK